MSKSRTMIAVMAAVLMTIGVGWPVAAQPANAATTFDGDPATTERVDAADPVAAAVAVSAARFADAGTQGRQAAHAILATTASFADSLAGAALSADGPLLLTAADALDDATATEIDRVLGGQGTVYVLGGEQAIAPAVVATLMAAGYDVRRLAGQTRVETALAIADEVRALRPSDVVLLARSDGPVDNPTAAWADSVPGGSLAAAAQIPIVVTPSAHLHPAVEAWLDAADPSRTIVLGGEAAVAEAVLQALIASGRTGVDRVAGPERTATAAAIAERLWDDLVGGDRARRFVILNTGVDLGWAFGLAAAGLSADAQAPPLAVVGNTATASTRRLVSTCGDADVDLVLVGDESVISAAVAEVLQQLDGTACASGFTALTPFSSCTDTLAYFFEAGLSRVSPYGLDNHWYGAIAAPGFVEEDEAFAPQPAPAAEGDAASDGGAQADSGGGEAEGGRDTSETNVQEVGVDEPDLVKTNGDAAYVVRGNQVMVVDLMLLPAPRVVGALDLPVDAFSHELLLHDDVLVVLSRGDGFVHPVDEPPASTTFAPEPYYPEPVTTVARFDVSDPTAPVELDSVEFDGSYRSARMIDGVVRVVSSSNPRGLDFVFPQDGSQEAADAALAHNRQVIVDSTITDWLPQLRTDDGETPLLDCSAVFAPPAFSGISTVSVVSVDAATSATPTSSAAVVAQAETIYASTERLVVTSSRWGEWASDAPPPTVTSEVHSFDISDPGATTYVASGQVDGYVLNQFAISERDGYYRIATTTEPPWLPVIDVLVDEPTAEPAPEPEPGTFQQAQDTTDNGITVLTEGGSELFEVGRVFGLGLGERIFAVRYYDDLAAVVTFRQVDPLYLVDLANPATPRVTGELKIPGVSRYLHPLGDDHLLGVGQDGDDDGRLTGLQISLFDISDRTDPRQAATVTYGPGASPVEFDHRAFLLWAPLDRAFVPAELFEEQFSGVKAIDIDTGANTLVEAGELQQPSGEFGGFAPYVFRTFVVDGTVFSVSYEGIRAHDLTTLTDLGFASFD